MEFFPARQRVFACPADASSERKILVSCHCAMDGGLPITQIHDVTGALEDRVKENFPQIARVTIHPEPVEEF
jgi:divalent metal cation (Fe/Co/Zn/Cd) transporter